MSRWLIYNQLFKHDHWCTFSLMCQPFKNWPIPICWVLPYSRIRAYYNEYCYATSHALWLLNRTEIHCTVMWFTLGSRLRLASCDVTMWHTLLDTEIIQLYRFISLASDRNSSPSLLHLSWLRRPTWVHYWNNTNSTMNNSVFPTGSVCWGNSWSKWWPLSQLRAFFTV